MIMTRVKEIQLNKEKLLPKSMNRGTTKKKNTEFISFYHAKYDWANRSRG